MPSRRFPTRPRSYRFYTEEDRRIVLEMRRANGSLMSIARRLRVTVRTLKKHFHAELMLGDPKIEAALTADIVRRALAGKKEDIKFVLTRKFGWGLKPPPPPHWSITGTKPYAFSVRPGIGQEIVSDDAPEWWSGPWPPEGCIRSSSADWLEQSRRDEDDDAG